MQVSVPIRGLIAFAFVILVTVLSVTPGRGRIDDSVFVWLVVNTPTLLQKIMHIGVYAFLAFLLVWTLEEIGSRWLRLAIAFTFAVSLGAVLEWYQTQVPGRFGTVFDVLLNAGGTVLGLLAALLVL